MNTQTYPYFTMSPFLCPTTTLSHMRVDSEAHLSPPPPCDEQHREGVISLPKLHTYPYPNCVASSLQRPAGQGNGHD